jgi:hypothetical protein
VGNQTARAEVVSWLDTQVTLVVPDLEIESDTDGVLEVSRSDGKLFRKLPIRLKADKAEIVVDREASSVAQSGN